MYKRLCQFDIGEGESEMRADDPQEILGDKRFII